MKRLARGSGRHLRSNALAYLLFAMSAALLTVIRQRRLVVPGVDRFRTVYAGLRATDEGPQSRLHALVVGFLYWLINIYWIEPITIMVGSR